MACFMRPRPHTPQHLEHARVCTQADTAPGPCTPVGTAGTRCVGDTCADGAQGLRTCTCTRVCVECRCLARACQTSV